MSVPQSNVPFLLASLHRASRDAVAVRRSAGQIVTQPHWPIAEEIPIALIYNGISHAVMMATPTDLEDFATGFSWAENIARSLDDIRGIEVRETGDGIELEITLSPSKLRSFLSERRVRALRGHTSCGLCGIEDLERVGDGASRVALCAPLPSPDSIARAVGELRGAQSLGRETHATHAAAWADLDGEITLIREDVGRHCALDKLVGACMRQVVDLAAGFAVVTSRCSFEMVQKAISAGMPTLVAVSAPTGLAVRTATAAGLNLVASARPDSHLVFNGREA